MPPWQDSRGDRVAERTASMKLFGNNRKKNNSEKISNRGDRPKTPKETEEIEAQIAAYQKKKRRRRIILSSALVTIAVALFAAYKYIDTPPPVDTGGIGPGATANPDASESWDVSPPVADRAIRKDGVYTFLIAGTDDGNGLTDTMMVGMLDTVNNTLEVVNIPRDTLVNAAWSGTALRKANMLWSWNKNGVDGLKSGIRDIIGYNVDYYAIVDLVAFEKLVTVMGGVYFDVPIRMNYNDPTQNLVIDVQKGYQLLNGKDALGVVRYRYGYPDADIGRIATQQAFLKAVAKQLLQIGNVTKINEFAKIFVEYVDTDMSLKVLAYFGLQFLNLTDEDINFQTIPADYNDTVNKTSYVTILIDEWVELLNEKLNPYNAEIMENMLNILTRNKNGAIYATSGTIAGSNQSWGSGSVSASGSGSGSSSSGSSNGGTTASATPTPSQTPQTTAPPVTSDPAASESPDTGGTPDVTEPSDVTEPPAVVTDTPVESGSPPVSEASPPIETANPETT